MAAEPLIFAVKGNSLDDGPGIRTVVFFKGCPLSCTWCHNPEGQRKEPEIAFDAEQCVGAHACRPLCTPGALTATNTAFVDRKRCTLCYECVDACPSGALERVGEKKSIREILDLVEKDLPFFETSGGGVTLSGGEATLFMEFAGELAKVLSAGKIHVLLETCGAFSTTSFDIHLYPHLKAIYYDLKLADAALHKKHCGTDNRLIFDNFATLHRRAKSGGVPILPRIPLVPDITATDKNLIAIATFLRALEVTEVALMPYNPLWPAKVAKLGQEAPATERFLTAAELTQCRSHFDGFNLV